jgi:chromatin remodeling complex protein RSC6
MATAKKSAAKKAGAKKATTKSAAKGGATKSAAKGGAAKKAGAAKGGAAKGGAKTAAKGASKGAAKGGATKSASKGASKTAKGGRGPNPAFMKPMQPSPELAAVVGNEPQPRSQITSRVWDYIKKNGLQDQKNRRQINADDNLRAVFGGKSNVSMFEMTKLVNNHLQG